MKKKYWMIIDTVIILFCAVLLFGKMIQMMSLKTGADGDIGSSKEQFAMESQDESKAEDTVPETETQEEKTAEQQEESINNIVSYKYSYSLDGIVHGEYMAMDSNGNLYEFYVADATWEDAYWKCIEMGGHLATFDPDEDYELILGTIAANGYDNIKFYIGAKRELDSEEYRWLDENGNYYGGSINGSGNWMIGEPSFYDTELEKNQNIRMDEDCVNMFYYSEENRWVWNDIPNDLLGAASYYSGKIGFICEYEYSEDDM